MHVQYSQYSHIASTVSAAASASSAVARSCDNWHWAAGRVLTRRRCSATTSRRPRPASVRQTASACASTASPRGDAAVRDYTKKFDRIDPPSLAFTAAEIDAAVNQVDAETMAALELAATRIRDFHARHRPVGHAAGVGRHR